MKKFFFSICALAAIVSCSKSEVINAPGAGQVIAFDSYFGKAATKATAYETANLREDGFDVFAFTHADGVAADYNTVWHEFNLTYTPATASWGYGEVPVYWPSNGNQVDFFTFPTVAGVTVNEAKTGFTFAVNETATEQVDLVAAKAALNKTVADGAVRFEFKHLLSRVAFELANTGTSAITVSSVKLYGDFYKQGTVDLTAETLAIVTADAKTAEDVTFDGESAATSMAAYELLPEETSFTGTGYIHSGDEANKYMMLIPATAKGISVTYTIAGDETIYIVTKKFDTEVTLAASSAYKFTFKVSTDAIEFEVADDLTWGEESGATGSITL